MADVFISYNREDKPIAHAVAGSLEAEGFSVWWDAALRAGESYDEVTERNLREAGAVVVLWSKRSVNSKWVRAEATVGERHSRLVPALIEECDRPLRFELVQTADLTQWQGDRGDPNWRALVADIKVALGSAQPRAATAMANAADATSIETTFWNSIKDGGDPAELEAYLKRFPSGHFRSIAEARLNALLRTATAQAAAATRSAGSISSPISSAPTPRVLPAQGAAPPTPKAPVQQGVPQSAQAATRPPPPQAKASPPQPSQKKSSAGGLILVLGLLGVAGLGVAGFLLSRKPGEPLAQGPDLPRVAASSETAAPVVEVDDERDTLSALAVSPETSSPVETGLFPSPGELGASATADSAEASPAPEAASDAPAGGLTPKAEKFSDCVACPEMRILAGGAFLMGSPKDEPGHNGYEGPQRTVTVAPFAIGVHEVTFDQWQACIDDGGCGAHVPGDKGWGRGSNPVIFVSWKDAKAYAAWLSRKTGRAYRLPSEAEWEFAARGGTESAYWWGPRFDRAKVSTRGVTPAGSLPANDFGIHDVAGNVREWVEDCYVNGHADRPDDGRAIVKGDCGRRVIKGGAWSNQPVDMRIANRIRISDSVRVDYVGFRVAADLD